MASTSAEGAPHERPREEDERRAGRGTERALVAVTSLLRLGACVFVGVTAFALPSARRSGSIALVAAYLLCTAAVVWWLTRRRRALGAQEPRTGVAVALVVMALAGGLVCGAPDGAGFIAFPVMAVLAAGADERALFGWLVAGVAVLAVELGALVFDGRSGIVLGGPLLLLVAFVAGRNRRSYLVQAEQSAAMVEQLELLRAQQRQVAVLDERTRIAREIHDVLAHSLGALAIQVQAARAVLQEGRTDSALSLLEQAHAMARDGLVDTRRAVQALRGESTGLDEQIRALVEVHRTRHAVRIELVVDGERLPVTAEAVVALTRTAAEALVNTAKHAPHEPVEVRLRHEPDEVQLTVSNRLSDPAETDSGPRLRGVDGGYGLTGMHERLLLIGGTLTAGPSGSGWTVSARAPR